jgi:hypothetical protein
MAGSYKHCCKADGSFRNDGSFTDLIENLGDAWEACEMMHWMINFLSGGDPEKIEVAEKEYYKALRPIANRKEE